MTLRDQLLVLSDRYAAARDLSRARVSTLIFNGGHVLDGIDAGRDITTRSYEKALAWLSAHWPDGADWPEGIARPKPAEPASPEAA